MLGPMVWPTMIVEDRPLRLRFSFLALVFAPLLLAGCDPPQARFVYSERTDALIPAVRDRV